VVLLVNEIEEEELIENNKDLDGFEGDKNSICLIHKISSKYMINDFSISRTYRSFVCTCI